MSRKVRETKRNFKVFCEGDTEHNYIDEMKRQKKPSIALKSVNMKGGGYSSFLEQVRTDSNTNCLAKFIIIDGDRAVCDEGEKKNLRELLEYCILQNQSGRIPHFLIVDYPDFEYIACLHTPMYKGQNVAQYIVHDMGYKSIDDFKADKKIYYTLNSDKNSYKLMLASLKKDKCFVSNQYTSKLGWNGSNINEFF